MSRVNKASKACLWPTCLVKTTYTNNLLYYLPKYVLWSLYFFMRAVSNAKIEIISIWNVSRHAKCHVKSLFILFFNFNQLMLSQKVFLLFHFFITKEEIWLILAWKQKKVYNVKIFLNSNFVKWVNLLYLLHTLKV